MFVGHYGVSFAAKKPAPRLSLGALFLAVQLLDILFAIFVLLGVEKLRIVPGFTAFNPYDLYWMPYSHSLLAALIWSALTTLVALAALRHLRSRDKRIAAGLLGAAVFSHFLLDLPMHTPDLPLGLDAASPKIGLGLWNHPVLSLAAELLVLGVGVAIYLRATRARSRAAAIRTWVFAGVLVALTLATPFFPVPPSDRAFALQALAALRPAGGRRALDRPGPGAAADRGSAAGRRRGYGGMRTCLLPPVACLLPEISEPRPESLDRGFLQLADLSPFGLDAFDLLVRLRDQHVDRRHHEQREHGADDHARHQHDADAVARAGARAASRRRAASGPTTVAAVVIRIGRSRVAGGLDHGLRACRGPVSCRWLANSTIRMPFFATRPTSVIRPTWL